MKKVVSILLALFIAQIIMLPKVASAAMDSQMMNTKAFQPLSVHDVDLVKRKLTSEIWLDSRRIVVVQKCVHKAQDQQS